MLSICVYWGFLTLNIPKGVLLVPQRVIFCDLAVTISTNLLLIFVCVPHQLEINIIKCSFKRTLYKSNYIIFISS